MDSLLGSWPISRGQLSFLGLSDLSQLPPLERGPPLKPGRGLSRLFRLELAPGKPPNPILQQFSSVKPLLLGASRETKLP